MIWSNSIDQLTLWCGGNGSWMLQLLEGSVVVERGLEIERSVKKKHPGLALV